MSIVEKLKLYNFRDFKMGHLDPKGKYIADVMEEVARNSEEHTILKEKIDVELGFDKKRQRGITYPTLIKYLALALEDIDVTS